MTEGLPDTRYAYIYHLGDNLNGDKDFQHLVTMEVPIGYLTTSLVTKDGLVLKYGKDLYRLPLPGYQGDTTYKTSKKLDYNWKSKEFVFPGRTTLAAVKVVRDCYGTCLFSIYVDGKQFFQAEVCNSDPFRLPSQLMGVVFEVQVQGTATVKEIHVASSMKELTEQ